MGPLPRWITAGLVSAAICAFSFALTSYALGSWLNVLVLPIGFIIGTMVQNSLGESTGRWPARTAAVLTLLAGILAKAGGFFLRVELDFHRSREFENRLSEAVLDFTFGDLMPADFLFFFLAVAIAYRTAFCSNPATTTNAPTTGPSSADQAAAAPDTVFAPAAAADSSNPGAEEQEFSDFDVKRTIAESQLTVARITMFLIGGVILCAQANVIINARKGLDKLVRQELRHTPLSEIDPAEREQLMDEGVRVIRFWAGGYSLIGIAYLAAGLMVKRYPIAATTTALVLFAGAWATSAYQGEPTSPGANVVRIVVTAVLVFALHAFIQFRKECMRWIRTSQSATQVDSRPGNPSDCDPT